jgi:hypothetical protein
MRAFWPVLCRAAAGVAKIIGDTGAKYFVVSIVLNLADTGEGRCRCYAAKIFSSCQCHRQCPVSGPARAKTDRILSGSFFRAEHTRSCFATDQLVLRRAIGATPVV